jgi:hypothetical protein
MRRRSDAADPESGLFLAADRGKVSVLTPVAPAVCCATRITTALLSFFVGICISLSQYKTFSIHRALDPICVNLNITRLPKADLHYFPHQTTATAWSEPFSTYSERDSFTAHTLPYQPRRRDTTIAHQPQHLLDRQDDHRRRASVA